MELINALRAEIGFEEASVDEDVAKVSVIGVGMRSHTGVAKTMFGALADRGVNIQVISTSEIKISVLIEAAYTELAVRALHAAYGLDQL
jgi:aspartate kinase